MTLSSVDFYLLTNVTTATRVPYGDDVWKGQALLLSWNSLRTPRRILSCLQKRAFTKKLFSQKARITDLNAVFQARCSWSRRRRLAPASPTVHQRKIVDYSPFLGRSQRLTPFGVHGFCCPPLHVVSPTSLFLAGGQQVGYRKGSYVIIGRVFAALSLKFSTRLKADFF